MTSQVVDAAVPRGAYTRRTAELALQRASLQSRERLTGYAQLALAGACVLWVILRMRHFQAVDLLVLVPSAVFIALAVVHGRMQRTLGLQARAIRFYEQGLARLNGNWAGSGVTGERFLEPVHPYARDLDLFGRAGLFELLCTARTRAGEEKLAQWLLAPSPPQQVLERQQAAVDLSDRLAFRERLATLGQDIRLGVHPAHLLAWGAAPSEFPSGLLLRIVTVVMAFAWVLSVVGWRVWGLSQMVVLALTLANLIISYVFRRRIGPAAHAAEEAGHDLKLLSEVLLAFEREPFTSTRLVALQAKLRQQGTAPSVAIARLSRLVESLESAHNLFVRVFDFVVFYRLQFLLATDHWRRQFGSSLPLWLEAIGELEALASLGAYTYEHPEDVFPEFVEGAPYFAAQGLAHPLLPRDRAVANDLRFDQNLQLMILSGPNMAGKSTFLRGIGVNAVLAQCGAPVRAVALQLSPLTVTASICVLDSLEGGISRFYAEINRLKLIMDLTGGPSPVLFLLDELLSGTNSHDRLIGTRSLVKKLVERGAVGLVSTHDLSLTAIPAEIGPKALNTHFEDHLEAGKLVFDYKLYPGIVQTSNALPLMRSIGLEV